MLTIHHLGVSQSERIVWLCEELEIPYTLKRYDRDPTTRLAPVDYKALHPMEIAPIITDGDLVLAESGAIIEYIIAKHGGGRLAVRADAPNFADYLFWFHFANGTLVPSQMAGMIAAMLGADKNNSVVKMFDARSDRALAMVETRLSEVPFLAGGDLTAADIVTVFSLTTMRAFAPRDLTPFPNILSYLKRISERPAYRRAMAAGDPGMTPMVA